MYFNTFRGGIHPPGHKKLSRDKSFTNLSIPHRCYIPLQQHIGKPAIPLVDVDDIVEEGQMIGKADGFISANIHASIPGRVVEITDYPTVYSEHGKCVVIETEGSFSSSGKNLQSRNWQELSSDELMELVYKAGIAGMGGAAFPTAVKLDPPEHREIDTFVVNGAECEPYLTVDDMLMQTYPDEIIEGIRITLKILKIDRAAIGIEKNKPKAIKAVAKALAKGNFDETIELHPLPVKYPQGAEKQLIYTILKREVPSGELPLDVGVVVNNVGTIFAMREAVLYEKPLIERYLTVTGSIVKKPGNYKVRIGTRISDIIEECGGLTAKPAKIIMGGPMCGLALNHMEISVVKGTSGILVLGQDEVTIHDYGPCIRCGRCVTACPVNLIPNELGNAVEKQRYDIAEKLHPFDCIMCGSCTYICPSKRPLSHFIKLAQVIFSAKR